jgi:hypothetical protein
MKHAIGVLLLLAASLTAAEVSEQIIQVVSARLAQP